MKHYGVATFQGSQLEGAHCTSQPQYVLSGPLVYEQLLGHISFGEVSYIFSL